MQAHGTADTRAELEALLPAERSRLVRLCASLSGSADAAEDLAQETMIEAWRHAGQLRNPDARRQWLSGIARNVCRRWARDQGRDAAGEERLARQAAVDAGIAPGDVLADLERDEVATLLDRAMHRLPATTRDVLTLRYIDEQSHTEIAGRLGLSEGAVAVRAHRGRLALKAALSSPDLRAEAAAYGLVGGVPDGWRSTRIWCPFCGRHRLDVRIDREARDVSYRCAGRCFGDGTILDVRGAPAGTHALTSPRSILSRQLVDLDDYYRRALVAGGDRCHACGQPIAVERWSPDGPASLARVHPYGIRLLCRACGFESGASLWHLLLDTPHAQRFWRRYPRMAALPVREIVRDGMAALAGGFASLDGAARLEIVSARETHDILHVEGAIDR